MLLSVYTTYNFSVSDRIFPASPERIEDKSETVWDNSDLLYLIKEILLRFVFSAWFQEFAELGNKK